MLVRTLTTQINVTNSTNTFSRSYPVKGSIKKGQGVGLFRDASDSNRVKMRASDTQQVFQSDLRSNVLDNFARNVNNLEIRL